MNKVEGSVGRTSPELSPMLRREQTRQALAWFNRALLLRSVYDVVCVGSGIVFIGYALALGIEGEKLGRLTMAATVGCVFQLLVLPALAWIGDYKRFVLIAGVAEPLVLAMTVMLAPWLPPDWRLPVILAGVLGSGAFLHSSRPLLDDWLASTIPISVRGRYMGRRLQTMSLAMMVAVLAAGRLADLMGKDNYTGMAVLLAVGSGFGVLSVLALAKVKMTLLPASIKPSLADLKTMFRQPLFIRHVLGAMWFQIPFIMAVPFYQVYYQKALDMDKTHASYAFIFYQVVRIGLLPACGKLVERWGPRQVLALAFVNYAIFFVVLVAATPDRWWPVYAAWAFAGVADSLFGVAGQLSLLGSVPKLGLRPAYFAVANLCSMGPFFIGPLIAEPLLYRLASVHLDLGFFQLGQYHWLYVINLGILLLSIPCIRLFMGRRDLNNLAKS